MQGGLQADSDCPTLELAQSVVGPDHSLTGTESESEGITPHALVGAVMVNLHLPVLCSYCVLVMLVNT